MSCRCLVRCANVAPQTRKDKQRTTQGKTGDGAGRRRGKRRRGRGADAKMKAGDTQDAETTANAKTKAGGTQEAGTTEHAARPLMIPGTEASARRTGVADRTKNSAEGEGAREDVPGYAPTPEDLHIWEVYGDWVYGNPGTHLDGGVTKDGLWQGWWRDLAVMPSRR